MNFQACAVVPSHNHYVALGAVVRGLRDAGLGVVIVDDASDEPASAAIAGLHAPASGVEVVRLPVNRGKGGAVIAGLHWAHLRGFTHVVQIDADGQHDLTGLSQLIATARLHPEALISGRPCFDASMPRGRRFGRWITHIWVWVETLSTRIADSMCGYRVYPLDRTLRVLNTERVGQRMDFDPELMVRLFWRGTPVIHVPVRVVYPPGNTSHFHPLRDNWLISWMHTRLVFTMIVRMPSILRNRPAKPQADPAPRHWSAVAERGAYWGLKSLKVAYLLLGRSGCLALMRPVVAYFYATDPAGRRHSRIYLTRVHARIGRAPPSWRTGFQHYMSFAGKALDSFIAWTDPLRSGPIKVASPSELDRLADLGTGVLLIVSHLGNADVCRASLATHFKRRVNVLIHTQHATLYNGLIRSLRPDVEDYTIQVTDIGPQTAIELKECVERGEWLAIAGDRTPVHGQQRTCRVPFLGAEASFPVGPYILAALMGCPVYLMFCLREGSGHTVHFEKLANSVSPPRHDRERALADLAARYAQRLEHYCLQAPLQWYNFYDFWADAQTRPLAERGSEIRSRGH
jgi:predicted LPLAT superfamily acyltransferase/glycosyltransferase involved in cell wall biosynthesis